MAKKTPASADTLLIIYNKLYGHFGPQNWWPGDSPFEVAVGAILTQNTNWGNVEKAIDNIKEAKSLDPRILHEMPHEKLASLIRPAGYFNVKAKRLKNFLSFLNDKYGGSMTNMLAVDKQKMREGLLSVNGIGPETADSILLYALNKSVFVIDAYTKRILSRQGIVSETIGYDEMQDLFHSNIEPDTELYNEYHALLVMLGKDFCRPKPRCEKCPLKK